MRNAPLPSPEPTHVYAGLVSLEAPDIYINDEDGYYDSDYRSRNG